MAVASPVFAASVTGVVASVAFMGGLPRASNRRGAFLASPWSGSDGSQRLRGQGRKQKIFGGADPKGEDVLRPLPAEGRPITLSPREPGSAATSSYRSRPSSGGLEPVPEPVRSSPPQ